LPFLFIIIIDFLRSEACVIAAAYIMGLTEENNVHSPFHSRRQWRGSNIEQHNTLMRTRPLDLLVTPNSSGNLYTLYPCVPDRVKARRLHSACALYAKRMVPRRVASSASGSRDAAACRLSMTRVISTTETLKIDQHRPGRNNIHYFDVTAPRLVKVVVCERCGWRGQLWTENENYI
jgi:hypothetical protein